MSLFTKLLGRGQLLSGTLMGALSSVAALGPALAQLLFAPYMLSRFGTWSFGLFILPVLAAAGLVCCPYFWERLDPDREFNRAVRAGYAAAHQRKGGAGGAP